MNGSVYLFALVLLLGLAVCLAHPMETMGEDRRAVIWGNQGSAHKNEALGALQLHALLERYRATPQDGAHSQEKNHHLRNNDYLGWIDYRKRKAPIYDY